MKFLKQNPLVAGTIILTMAGFLSRLIGFFYRIYLTKLFGEEGMGIYQLTSPVLSLSFSLTAAGFQTALSKIISEKQKGDRQSDTLPLTISLIVATSFSLLTASVIYKNAGFIASALLKELRTVTIIKVLSVSVPAAAIHACFNGYFYGKQSPMIPAITQLIEQFFRVGAVYFIVNNLLAHNAKTTPVVAAYGITIGEYASLISVIIIYINYRHKNNPSLNRASIFVSEVTHRLFKLIFPLTLNRITINLLQSVENTAIPLLLISYGLSRSNALSLYGVVTGMVFPLIFFPNALTNSLAVILLPDISKNHSGKNNKALLSSIKKSIAFSFWLGFCFSLIFCLAGPLLGAFLFKSHNAGIMIRTLGFICPFLYLNTTLSGILQGFGLVNRLFIINCSCMSARLIFIYLLIPKFGLIAYLLSILFSQLVQTLLYICSLKGAMQQYTH